MSANINFNEKCNTYSFVSHKETAWHGLGTIVDEAMTSTEAITLANLDYIISKAKVLANIKNNGMYITKEIDNTFATYRTDTLDVFGVVGERYEVVQNKEAFAFMDSIIGKGKAIYETAGALGKGEVVFITAKLPYYIRLNGEDTIENYLVVSISHDASKSVNIFLTPIRIVCQNTLAYGKSNARFMYKFRHTKSVHNKMIDASELLTVTKTITEENQEIFNKLSKTNISDIEVKKYINSIFLTTDELIGLANENVNIRYSDIISTRKKNVINDVFKYYNIGVGQDNIVGSVFGAYNAVTGYLSNVKKYSNESKKMDSLILGGIDMKLNNKAFEYAKQLV